MVVKTDGGQLMSHPRQNVKVRCQKLSSASSFLVKFSSNVTEKEEKSRLAPNRKPYPHSKEFGTVIEDDDDSNADSEKKLPFAQKLELSLSLNKASDLGLAMPYGSKLPCTAEVFDIIE
ncbi:hypothetical protein TNCV_4049251 [Trichonephila clavipes]|nr:hypothetical protein TNCV_4049251 [Trichonephila clavipes]